MQAPMNGLSSSTAAGTFSDRRRLNSVRRVLVAMIMLALTACGSVKYGGAPQTPPTPELEYPPIDTNGQPPFFGPPAGRMPSDDEAPHEGAALRAHNFFT